MASTGKLDYRTLLFIENRIKTSTMNRFEFAAAILIEGETVVVKNESIKIYDGHEKVIELVVDKKYLILISRFSFQTLFEDGEVVLTTHRMFWGKAGEFSRGSNIIQLRLKYVKSLDEEMGSSMFFGKKRRLIIRLNEIQPDKTPGPMEFSATDFIKLSGPNGIGTNFVQAMNETLLARVWQISEPASSPSSPPRIKQRSGIGGIEKGIQEKQKQADQNMSAAFQDLNKLIGMAKEMVTISKAISQKIRERQSDASEDETLKFKTLLMSLGIDDPVTKDNFTNNTEYLRSLGNEICQSLLDVITVSKKLEFSNRDVIQILF